MVIINAEQNHKIHIGRAGEHLATKVIFDISEWIEQFGERYTELVVEQNSMCYPQLISVEGNEVSWEVTRSNTAEPGIGKCELFYFGEEELVKLYKKPEDWASNWKSYYLADGSMVNTEVAPEWPWENYSDDILYYEGVRPIIKSAIYEIIVTNALGYGEDEPPGPYESWVDDVLNAATDAKEARDQAREAQRKAEEAQRKAEAAQTKAEAAQTKAEEAQQKAEAAQKAAEEAQTKAETAQGKAEEAQRLSEAAQKASEEAQRLSELARDASQEAQRLSEEAQAKSELAQKAAEEAEARAKAQAYLSKQSADASAASAAAASDAKDEALKSAQSSLEQANRAFDEAGKAAGSATAAIEAAAEALRYVGNPPIPDEDTKTWWVYDPEDAAANEEGYVNTQKPYSFHVDYVPKNLDELKAIEDMKLGDMAAIQASISDPLNAQLYIYTGVGSENGWEFLLDLSGATGNGISSIDKTDTTIDENGRVVDTYTITYTLSNPTTFVVVNGKDGANGTGSGDMLAADYDKEGVVKKAGGIEAYVESVIPTIEKGGTEITWKKWSADDLKS